jgi:hypothetical protein
VPVCYLTDGDNVNIEHSGLVECYNPLTGKQYKRFVEALLYAASGSCCSKTFALSCPEGSVTVCQSIRCKVTGDLTLYQLCSQNLKPDKFTFLPVESGKNNYGKKKRFNDYF